MPSGQETEPQWGPATDSKDVDWPQQRLISHYIEIFLKQRRIAPAKY